MVLSGSVRLARLAGNHARNHAQRRQSSKSLLAQQPAYERGGQRVKRGGQRILAEAEDASSFGFANDDGEGDDGDDLYPDLSLWGENEEKDAGRGVEASGAAAEDEGEDGEGFGEDWRAEGNETAARKKGRTWHKYMKTSRELKRLQNLLPDLEGGSLFDEGEVETLGDGEGGGRSRDRAGRDNLRDLEQQLERSGLAYVAKGGKPQNVKGVLRNLGWGGEVGEASGSAAAEEEEEGSDIPGGGSIVIDDETAGLFDMEAYAGGADASDEEEDEATKELRRKLEEMEDHPYRNASGGGAAAAAVASEEEIESTLAETPEEGQESDEDDGRADWAEYEDPPAASSQEQRLLERAMFSSTIRMIHDQEQQSIDRARVTWYLKEQFNSEFVLSNYLAHMARSIQEEVDGIEIVSYEETGTFIARYKPMIMSKVLFDLEEKLKTGEVDIAEINELQLQSNRKADLLEKTIAFLCDRSIRMQVRKKWREIAYLEIAVTDQRRPSFSLSLSISAQLAKHLRRNLSFKRDQAELPAEERLDLDRLEESLGVERVENIIVGSESGEGAALAEVEQTTLDFLLKEDAPSAVEGHEPGTYPTFKPLCEEDYLPDLPEDAVIQFSIDGERVEIDLSKVGEQAVWIRQLLGYKKSDRDHMDSFDRMMRKTESAFQVRPKKRRDKRGPRRGDRNGGGGGHRQVEGRDESRMFQEAVDIFGTDMSNEQLSG